MSSSLAILMSLALLGGAAGPLHAAEEPPLKLLATPPDRSIHHHINRISVNPGTLETGWADLRQCHENMDALGATQIVFSEGRVRGIEITRTKNIDSARVEGPTVQLDGVRRGAEVCLRAETRALARAAQDEVVVRNGPFMRRFLDSYFPMHVTLTIVYPPEQLELMRIRPEPQPGLSATSAPGRLELEIWFDGILRTEVHFRIRSSDRPS